MRDSVDAMGEPGRSCASTAPRVLSVVICTRDRGAQFVAAVESIIEGDLRPDEIVVVDQSADERARDAGRRFAAHAGFSLHHVDSTGLARARNAGMMLARGDVVAFTDDDCVASPDWLAGIAAGFASDPRVGLVFGNVQAGPHDRSHGFIPAYVRDGSLLATSIRHKHRAEGMGANMAVSRVAWAALGGFDERLGAGGSFRAGEDIDFALRALERGHAIYETACGHVVHLGFRRWDDSGRVAYDYLYGLGATYAKHLKCGEVGALVPMAGLAWRWIAGRPAVDLGRTPPRWLRLRGFAAGFLAAARAPVDARWTRFAADRPAI